MQAGDRGDGRDGDEEDQEGGGFQRREGSAKGT
jgi:hypothetical protein